MEQQIQVANKVTLYSDEIIQNRDYLLEAHYLGLFH